SFLINLRITAPGPSFTTFEISGKIKGWWLIITLAFCITASSTVPALQSSAVIIPVTVSSSLPTSNPVLSQCSLSENGAISSSFFKRLLIFNILQHLIDIFKIRFKSRDFIYILFSIVDTIQYFFYMTLFTFKLADKQRFSLFNIYRSETQFGFAVLNRFLRIIKN